MYRCDPKSTADHVLQGNTTMSINVSTPVHFASCGFFRSEGGWSHSERVLDSYECIIMLDKNLKIQVDERKFSLDKGDFLLIKPGIRHVGYQKADADTRFFWAHFYLGPEQLLPDRCIPDLDVPDNSRVNQSVSNGGTSLYRINLPSFMSKIDMGKATIYCHQLCDLNESSLAVPGSTNYIMTSLLNEIATQYLSRQKENNYYGNIPKIMEWIRINHANPISVSDVAEHFQYSTNYMSHYFSKHLGISMQKYITGVRIRRACELLLETRDTIIEIADQVGFRDSKYFLRIFKQYMSQTPSQYRNAFNRTHYNKK